MIRPTATWRWVALVGASAVALAACDSSTDAGAGDPGAGTTSSGTPLYLVDGNIGNRPLAELPPGTLAGVTGTFPGAASSDEFKDRLNEVDPKLKKLGYSYAPESYDAVTLVALSAVAAKRDAGRDIASQMQAVSRDGTKCTSFTDCADLLKTGENIDYDGQSGPIEFDKFGDPSQATIGIYQYNETNEVPGRNADADPNTPVQYRVGSVNELGDPAPKLASTVNAGAGDGVLTIGSLASLGPAEVAAAQLAVQDINAAGGVLGKAVKFIVGDSGDTTTHTASKTVDEQLTQGVDAIIGAASPSVRPSIIDKITGAGVVQVSPANTSPDLTTHQDGGLYFQTAASDRLQGRVLGDLVTDDGYRRIGILSLQGSSGEGLAKFIEQSITEGGGQVLDTVFYDQTASSFSTEVQKIAADGPDAIILIGFDESAKVVSELVKQGVGPNSG